MFGSCCMYYRYFWDDRNSNCSWHMLMTTNETEQRTVPKNDGASWHRPWTFALPRS